MNIEIKTASAPRDARSGTTSDPVDGAEDTRCAGLGLELGEMRDRWMRSEAETAKATGKEQQIRIQASGGLSDADIQKMVKEAEANAGADKKRRAFIEAKNHAEAMVHKVGKTLAEHGASLVPAEKTEADSALAAVRTTIDGDDHDRLTQVTEALSKIEIKLQDAASKPQPGWPTGPDGGKASGTSGEKVVDAEFEEVGDQKRSA